MKSIVLAALALARRNHDERYSLHPHREDGNYPHYDQMDYSQYQYDDYQYGNGKYNKDYDQDMQYADYVQDHASLHPHGKSLPGELNVFAFSNSFHKGFSLNSANAPSGDLKYKGGPVVSNVEVTPIYYGNFKYKSEITAFYKGIVDSSYMDWLAEYNTKTQKIGRGKGFDGIIVNKPKKSVTTNDLEELFEALIKQNYIKPNQNSYYPIHFAKGITITSESGMCTYHSSFTTKSKQLILYGILPDLDDQGCADGCGQSNDLENIMSTSAHELIETVTDPISDNLAWYDDRDDKGEIADICNQLQGTVVGGDGKGYVVQMQWSNKEKRCRL
ncbi:hypothetical protein HDV01_006517 [Terramyces sp. JEL0728]|nr:hypothetical protein HDV01_006517 [Terramyces sp. JEL0728]